MGVLPKSPIDWALLALAISTALIITLTLHDFFLESTRPNARVRAWQDVGLACAVSHFGVLLFRGSAGPAWAYAGIGLYLASTLLLLSTLESAGRVRLPRAFVDEPRPASLVTAGPFALVRHPFYVAYALAWLAAPVATHGVGIGAMAAIQVGGLVVAARREERQLEEQFGDAYRAYRKRAGMFFPFMG